MKKKRYKTIKERKAEKNRFLRMLIIALTAVAVIFVFSRSRAISEWYMQTIYPTVATLLSGFSNIFPFSIYDLFIVLAIIWLIRQIVLAVVGRIGFIRFLHSIIKFATVLIVWFYFGWGISYFREDFYDRADVEKQEYDTERFRYFAERYIEDANETYGEFEVLKRDEVKKEIEQSYKLLQTDLNIHYPNGKRRVKAMIFESLFTKMGVSGYFGPFFNEIHVNNYSLNFTYPFTLAHEMAHQFGVSAESEANLYAFIVCVNSNDERVRYSSYASTIGYVLNDMRRFIPDEYELLVSMIRPEIIADLQKNREHWMAARDESLSEAQSKAYDAYLKTNRVSTGSANYSEVVGLLVSNYENIVR